MVGIHVARQIARDLKPDLIVIVSLQQREVRETIHLLRKEFPRVTFDGAWGNIFQRAHRHEPIRGGTPANPQKKLQDLIDDTFGDKKAAYKKSWLVALITKFKPHILVDAINTATGLSYQDIFVTSLEIDQDLRGLKKIRGKKEQKGIGEASIDKIRALLASQSIPVLIRHVQLLHDAMVAAGTRIYLKIGTTGTGGMGLNIPYTHSEDKPSAKLMSKTAIAFAHTGLLFLMARTPNSPIVKEIKPAAMIGYRKVEYRPIKKGDRAVEIFHAKKQHLGEKINLLPDVGYACLGELSMVGVDTGENGFFTLGEFETITTLYQMEFLTPEEIAQNVVFELRGMNTGKDVIAAIDAAVMDPSYRAGILRAPVLAEMRKLEAATHSASVALGQLGPPELSKLLYEAHLLKIKYQTLANVLAADPADISHALETHVLHHAIRHTIVSIGSAILLSDGETILRGPRLNIPEYRGEAELLVSAAAVDSWAKKGWVDLRIENIKLWQERFRHMSCSRQDFYREGSAALGRAVYLADHIEIGQVVGWIFNNEPAIAGYRLKAM